MGKQRTDTERLDFLQKLNDECNYTGHCILQMSALGRGWRLHETTMSGAVRSVREAIDLRMDAMDKIEKERK